MKKGKVYRHKNPSTTLDILITRVIYNAPDKLKIKFVFVFRGSGRILSPTIERATLTETDLKNWEEVVND